MELRSSWPDLEEKTRKFKESLYRNSKELNVLDDILNLMRNTLDGKKQVEILRKHLEEKKNVKDQCIAEINSLNEKLESRKAEVSMLHKELQMCTSLESEAIIEREEKVENVKSIWKAQRLVINYYKGRLGCHIHHQEHDDVINFRYTGISEDENKRYLVKVTSKDGKWSCLDVVPKFRTSETLVHMLNETNDIQGFLTCIRKKFMKFAKN